MNKVLPPTTTTVKASASHQGLNHHRGKTVRLDIQCTHSARRTSRRYSSIDARSVPGSAALLLPPKTLPSSGSRRVRVVTPRVRYVRGVSRAVSRSGPRSRPNHPIGHRGATAPTMIEPPATSAMSTAMRRANAPGSIIAAREGFEPPESFPSGAFKAPAFGRSATSPNKTNSTTGTNGVNRTGPPPPSFHPVSGSSDQLIGQMTMNLVNSSLPHMAGGGPGTKRRFAQAPASAPAMAGKLLKILRGTPVSLRMK